MDPLPLSQAEYKLLLENAPVMIWRSNITSGCDYFNEGWLKFRGRSMEEEYGDRWAEGVHPEDLDACMSLYLESFRKREPFEMQYRLKRYDGAYRWILDKGSPFFGDDGEFRGFVGSCTDISDRIEAQRALDEAREHELANLRGLLPICMVCKKIRDSDGSWYQLELFISSHSKADFTHGLCPHCAKLPIR